MPDLKNIRQIGSPTDRDKIYVENSAYQRMHREEFAERRVFVLMGHTECAPGGYTTFVEDVIPVWDIVFSRGVPVWNSHVWTGVFGEVKRSFEHAVIVGWALDIKGMPPRLTPDVEAVHREHFGGAHQLLLLLDTLEREEVFYQNRSGYFCPKEGFYIYFDEQNAAGAAESVRSADTQVHREEKENADPQEARNPEGIGETVRQSILRRGDSAGISAMNRDIQQRRRSRENRISRENRTPDDDLVIIEYEERGSAPRARYRELMYQTTAKQPPESGSWLGSAAVVAAVLLLFAILGTGIRQGRFSLDGLQEAVESISTRVLPQESAEEENAERVEASQEAADAETIGTAEEDISALLRAMEQSGTDEGILVEEVPQGDIAGE